MADQLLSRASFPHQLAEGSQQIGIYAEPGSYLGLSLRDSLLDGGAVDSSGFRLLNFLIRLQDTLFLVISKQNRKPVLAKITASSPGPTFLDFKGYSLSNESKIINGITNYGESMQLSVHFRNEGGTASEAIKIRLSTIDTAVTIMDSILLCNLLNPFSDTIFTNAFSIRLSLFVADQQNITLAMDVTQKQGDTLRYYIVLTVNTPVLEFGVPSFDDKITGNGNSRPDPGETLNVIIPIINKGHGTMDPASLKISGKTNNIRLHDSILYIPSIQPDSLVRLILPIHVDTSAIPGIPLTITAKLDTLSLHIMTNIIIRPAAYSEDFETGNLNKLPWQSSTSLSWYASDNFPLDGNYSARSGKIGDSQTTDMEITLFVTDTGQIQFKYKVSSELDFDYFKFYVDNNLRKAVSGQSGLQTYSDTISKGWHTFLWRYTKDEADSYGDDCVWIDDILFPPAVIYPYYDGSVQTILYPSADSIFRSAVLPSVTLKNSGSMPIEPKKISYQLDSGRTVSENLFFSLAPGNTFNYTFHTFLLLPENQICTLRVYLDTPGDSINSNDTTKVVFKNLYSYSAQNPIDEEVRFYPNPAVDALYFVLFKTVNEGTLNIINMNGKNVRSINLNSKPALEESYINLTGLSAGSYFAVLVLDGRRYIEKFIKR